MDSQRVSQIEEVSSITRAKGKGQRAKGKGQRAKGGKCFLD